jgi:chromosome partitioning protein
MAEPKGPVAISVINMKGGVGKSTLSTLLCRYASRDLGLDVLAIDLDPQANLSQAFMGPTYRAFLREVKPSIVEIFNGYLPSSSTKKSPSSISVEDVAVSSTRHGSESLQIIPSRFDFSDNLISAIRPDPKVLARCLADNFQKKDLVVIDCAPTESILTRAAYHASGLILVPVKPEYFATIGFPLLQQSLTKFRSENRGHVLNVAGIVINNAFYDGGNDGGPEKRRALRDIRAEAAANEWHIFKEQIPHSRGFPKMMRGDFDYPGNALQYRRFAREFFDHIGLSENEALRLRLSR